MRIRARSLGFGGECVCQAVDGSQQKLVFVPGLIPGELADVKITKEGKNLLNAEPTEIIEPSINRREPPCPYVGRCGGCNLQHMDIDTQRSSKLSMIQSMLLKQGGIVPQDGVVSLSDGLPEFGYRKRVTLHLNSFGEVGFYKAGSTEVVPVDRCLIASDDINEVIRSLPAFPSKFARLIESIEIDVEQGHVRIVLTAHENISSAQISDEISLFESLPSLGQVFVRAKGRDYNLDRGVLTVMGNTHAGHFSQVNPSGNERLIQSVIATCPKGELTELYAGAGNFSFPLIEKGCFIDAVELDLSLVAAGRERARKDKVEDKITFSQMSCEQYVRKNSLKKTVLLDPPRAGAKEVVAQANWNPVSEVIYISCDLPSLTRDLKMLASKGLVTRKVEFVDMFPQTHHVELIAWLNRE